MREASRPRGAERRSAAAALLAAARGHLRAVAQRAAAPWARRSMQQGLAMLRLAALLHAGCGGTDSCVERLKRGARP